MPEKNIGFTASNYYISRFYRLAQRRGLDALELLDRAHIKPDVIDCPETRVNAEKLACFVRQLIEDLQDEAMSLAASRVSPGCLELLGKLTVQEPTLHEAVKLGIQFMGMVTNAYSVQLDVQGNTATLMFHLRRPELDPEHLLTGLILLTWHRYYSWLIAENISLNEVFFDFKPPQEVGEYSYLFPGSHVFYADFFGFSFHKKFLDALNVQNPESLKVFMEHCPAELFLQPKTDFSLSGDIQRLLIKRFRDGFPSIDAVADSMHMTKRTLIRKLKDEGTSYQKIKNMVRRDRAIHLLTSSSMTIGAVAEQVGFSDSAVFARAFKAWTKLSPKQYQLLSEPEPSPRKPSA